MDVKEFRMQLVGKRRRDQVDIRGKWRLLEFESQTQNRVDIHRQILVDRKQGNVRYNIWARKNKIITRWEFGVVSQAGWFRILPPK